MAVNCATAEPVAADVVHRCNASGRSRDSAKLCKAGRADSDEAACALGELAAARVELEAPDAPQAVRDESGDPIRGILWRDRITVRYAHETIGPQSITYTLNHAAAFRNCGAAGLLAPWKVRRAGAIG